MKRREFIAMLGGAAATWPLAVSAEQRTPPTVGFLHPGSPDKSASIVSAFRDGLADTGFVEGRNVTFDYRWGEGHNERLPQLADELVRNHVAVIATPSSPTAALNAKTATSTIPIVFSMGGDPVTAGLVASYNRPGGNVTGISSFNMEVGSKRIALLHELLPKATRFAFFVNPNSPSTPQQTADIRKAVSAISGQVDVLEARTVQEIEVHLSALSQRRVDALSVSPGLPFTARREGIVALAASLKLPAIYATREWTEAGGLLSYGPIVADEFRQAGIYAGRILKGEKPADLPILRPTKLELILNLKTAKALGLDVPPMLLARADQVIE